MNGYYLLFTWTVYLTLLFIVIRGPERYGVLSAKSRIELIVDSARKRRKPTHFISIPLVCESTKERFLIFKDLVLEECTKVRAVFFLQNSLIQKVAFFVCVSLYIQDYTTSPKSKNMPCEL